MGFFAVPSKLSVHKQLVVEGSCDTLTPYNLTLKIMWKKIETNETVFKIQKGDKISQKPGDPLSEFVTWLIGDGYISIVGVKREKSVRIFPLVLLIRENWWTKP